MSSILKCYYSVFVLFVVLLIARKFSIVHAILNDQSALVSTTFSFLSTTPIFLGEGLTHYPTQHGKVLKLRTTTARNRRLQLPFQFTEPLAACDCMDYWECIANNGHIYSYCGISDSEVCCFLNHHVKGNERFGARKRIKSRQKAPTTKTTEVVSTQNFVAEYSPLNQEYTVTTPPSNFPSESTLPDVDYFYSLEDGIGELKQLTTTTEQPSAYEITTASLSPNYDSFSCGTQAVDWDFNSKAEFKEWPWHVALLEIKEDLYICGGSLISNDLVVTAAHCINPYVTRQNLAKLKIRAGEYDVSTNDETDPHIEVIVEKIFVHPNFNNATLVNDIALVKLRQPLNYTNNIRPICLPHNSNVQRPRQCVVAGWGRNSESTPFSIVMKEIIVPLWKHGECEDKLRQRFGVSYKLAESALCAGERDHDACDGDGGGGLVCFDTQHQRFYLQGITSFGIGCGKLADIPGVYTNVSSYLSYIEAVNYFL